MKTTDRTTIAMTVAGCLSLAVYAMAQSHGHGGGGMGHGPTTSGGFGAGGPNGYGPTNNPGLSHMSDQGYQSSQFGRTNAQNAIDQHRPSSSPTATATVTTKTRKAKRSSHSTTTKSNRHQTTRTDRSGTDTDADTDTDSDSSTKSTTRHNRSTAAPSVSPTISPPYGATNNPGLTHMSEQGQQSSEQGRTTAQEAIDQHRPGASPTAKP